MPAINFQKQFAPLVESGQKRQTIRALRKDGRDPISGDRLFLYTGMRTKGCRKLMDTVCASTYAITIKTNGTIKLDGQVLHHRTAEELAQADGFESRDAMIAWFSKTHEMPFHGRLIKWSEKRDEHGNG